MALHTFKLYKSLIYETVKNETHITAHTVRATDSNAAELAYHEEAGDEAYHERKLERELYASLDKIKSELIGYLDTASENIGSNIEGDEITFSIELNERYNSAYLKPLADLVSKYVEDNMLFEWWTPINQNYAKVYSEHTELDRQSIMKCFIKNAPSASSFGYGDVTGSVDSGTSGTAITGITLSATSKSVEAGFGGTITYTLSPSGATDNISVQSTDSSVATASKTSSGKITIRGLKAGSAKIILSSSSNVTINATCSVTVS